MPNLQNFAARREVPHREFSTFIRLDDDIGSDELHSGTRIRPALFEQHSPRQRGLSALHSRIGGGKQEGWLPPPHPLRSAPDRNPRSESRTTPLQDVLPSPAWQPTEC